MQALYTAHAHATGGREGSAATDDSRLGVGLSTPKELGGNGGPGSNPEQLFAAGYAACFLGAIKFVAAQDKVKVPEDARVDAEVGIGKREDGTGFGLTVSLKASLPDIDPATAADLVKRADVVCPYSHATRGNIQVAVAAV
ncbi:Organic hydroperoxide resistance protein OhrB [Methylobacterium cerastii]|uniref:Organic hydroperoxide resistance protein OhrB n=1 Tax=Methylobacterium cerastii TaxID=932741 RepID=A0ABQ4QH71_9HYPH|nr:MULTISPECIES: organic hydroperoxide resistance protein [Methylobacterium]TXM64059.1 organic hydroperoxide resistance protein [Methylobacterium sp. WL120]TXM99254.1 organic hydroperoxide resistance protein [Methylobacterium sp. WL122]TXN79713.1 organic hydroperoxide resistance protein [Methylobacterium sp. WL8]GJD44598.1 Organic hydroperoxide resistance protein OhrB [Methylobacterium cerastii]